MGIEVQAVVRDAHPFLMGGGELGELIAGFNWGATALGPIEAWPQSLKTTVGLILRSHVPMVTLWKQDGVMIYNDAYAEFAAARHPRLLGSKVREGWPEVAEFNDNVMAVGLAGGALAYKDQELTLHRNGRPEQVWMNLDYSPVLDEAGRPSGVIAIVVETTERVKAERWRRGEQERLRRMFEQAPGFMAMLSGPEHRIELANPGYLRLIGQRDVVGRTVSESMPDAVEQGYVASLDQVFRQGEALAGAGVPFVTGTADGAPLLKRHIDIVLQPVRDDDGAVVGIFVQGADVSDREAARASLAQSEARNRQILDSAFDYAIIATDLDGRVTRLNAGAERILGWSAEQMQGQPLSVIATPEDRAAGRPEQERGKALREGAAAGEGWRLRQSGERFWASYEVTPLRDEAGAAVGFVKVLRDCTHEHDAEVALAEAEAQLRRAQEAGGVGVFSLDLSDNILRGTPEFFRIYGFENRRQMPLPDIEALLLPEDRPVIGDPASRKAGLARVEVEYRIRRADTGEERAIARRADYERDAEGRPIRLVGVVQDVTERVAVQRALEQSEAEFRILAQAMPNQVWASPPDGRLDWFNAPVYAYSGAAPGELDGDGWAQIVHPEDIGAAVERWTAALASGETYETEFRLRRADGSYIWHLARALPIRGEDGRIVRWVGTNTDIHARKLAEASYARDQERLWTLSPGLMVVAGSDGVIGKVNPAWTEVLGWAEAETIGRPFADFLIEADRAAGRAAFARLALHDAVIDQPLAFAGRDGRSPRHVVWTLVREGEAVYGFGRDVTDQRVAEEALRQSQKMEAVGQLTGGIAHDFNNLLQGITGSLDLVQKRINQGRVGELDRFIMGAMASANRASALTHRLLAFSRRQPLDPRPVRANPLIASMEDLLRRTLGERIALELVLAGGLWLTRCDPNQLESAILNLAINARDAMPDGGKLIIETGNAHLDSAYAATQRDLRPGQYVCVCVTDTGIGMSAETMARAFEPFFTTRPIGQGTGLGLSMIYGFARQSEGYAKIYSELGEGTTFKLYLPRSRGEAEEPEPVRPLSDSHTAESGETVLVVEDESVVRGLIVEVLTDLGYRAIEAADGNKGLDILQSSRRIDLLITDVGLPGLNGRQLADAARARRPGLKVLFMTGYAENAALATGFLEPGMAMITKPFAMEALATRIRDIIEGR